MRRRLLMVLLALGTLGGYTSGFASLARHRYHRCHDEGWERWESRGSTDSARGAALESKATHVHPRPPH